MESDDKRDAVDYDSQLDSQRSSLSQQQQQPAENNDGEENYQLVISSEEEGAAGDDNESDLAYFKELKEENKVSTNS